MISAVLIGVVWNRCDFVLFIFACYRFAVWFEWVSWMSIRIFIVTNFTIQTRWFGFRVQYMIKHWTVNLISVMKWSWSQDLHNTADYHNHYILLDKWFLLIYEFCIKHSILVCWSFFSIHWLHLEYTFDLKINLLHSSLNSI